MGSLGFCPCPYCAYWVRNPYLRDDGFALCEWYWDFLDAGNQANNEEHHWSTFQCMRRAVAAGRLLPSP
eukprot:4932093-Karenia_brevis.AAC.1